MSRRTVRYIKFPKTQSHEKSCGTAKVRCEPAIVQTKPRPRAEALRHEKETAAARDPKLGLPSGRRRRSTA